MRAGDTLLLPNGSTATIVSSTREDHPEGILVYNLTVEGAHTFFVADDQGQVSPVWVHNAIVYREVIGGVTRYVGITGNFARRSAEHLRIVKRVITEIEGVGNVSRKLARAIEHLLIEKFGRAGKDLGGVLANRQRGIDPRKLGKYADELKEAAKIIDELGLN